ncbi:MAG TPA: hypothetical protein VK869_14750 [Rubrobacteraceae bacterium]|nr:hypothetical protein [Rubrobacteraceae bacterium]
MTTNAINSATGDMPFLDPRGDERELSLLLTLEDAHNLRTHSIEDAAIDAEDILSQAEEANALDPVG